MGVRQNPTEKTKKTTRRHYAPADRHVTWVKGQGSCLPPNFTETHLGFVIWVCVYIEVCDNIVISFQVSPNIGATILPLSDTCGCWVELAARDWTASRDDGRHPEAKDREKQGMKQTNKNWDSGYEYPLPPSLPPPTNWLWRQTLVLLFKFVYISEKQEHVRSNWCLISAFIEYVRIFSVERQVFLSLT